MGFRSALLHFDLAEILGSPWELGEAVRHRDDGEKKRRERRKKNAPKWDGCLHLYGKPMPISSKKRVD
jgi:hypothetical protein